MTTNQTFFHSSRGLPIASEEVAREIVNFMKADDRRKYKITIGTDSERINETAADFVTAIVVHRIGNGGRYFWRRIDLEKIHTLRERIWREVIISLDIAKEFLSCLNNHPEEVPHFDFEIHVDVGEKGDTRYMIQELVGMIRAHNFEARTKPQSYAASNVADRHVKGY